MTPKNRIIDFLEFKKLNKNQFYMKTGLSNGYLDKGENITSDNIEKIIAFYPEINLYWLIAGKGNMLQEITTVENVMNDDGLPYLHTRRSLKNNNVKKITDSPDFLGVPIYNVPIDASFLERYRDEGNEFEPVGFLTLPRLRNCNFAALISGNSMYPLMKSGSIVVCRIIENFDYFDEGEMYFISTVNGFETVKYVQSGDNPDELKLIPHNEKIRPTIIKKNMVLRMCLVESWINFR